MFGWIARKVCQNRIAAKAACVRQLAREVEVETARLHERFDLSVKRKQQEIADFRTSLERQAQVHGEMLIEVQNTCTEVANRFATLQQQRMEYLVARLPLIQIGEELQLTRDLLRFFTTQLSIVKQAISTLQDLMDFRVRSELLVSLQPEFSGIDNLSAREGMLFVQSRIDDIEARGNDRDSVTKKSLIRLKSRLQASSEVRDQLIELKQHRIFLRDQIALLRSERDTLHAEREAKEAALAALREKDDECLAEYANFYHGVLPVEEIKEISRLFSEKREKWKVLEAVKKEIAAMHESGDYDKFPDANERRGEALSDYVAAKSATSHARVRRLSLLMQGLRPFRPPYGQELLDFLQDERPLLENSDNSKRQNEA